MAALDGISTIVIHCSDPATLSSFYRDATGWKETYADGTFVTLSDGASVQLGFQRVEGHRPPAWPGGPTSHHVDFRTADVGAAVDALVAAGAVKPEHQPGGADWTVVLDPEGNPFCVAPAS